MDLQFPIDSHSCQTILWVSMDFNGPNSATCHDLRQPVGTRSCSQTNLCSISIGCLAGLPGLAEHQISNDFLYLYGCCRLSKIFIDFHRLSSLDSLRFTNKSLVFIGCREIPRISRVRAPRFVATCGGDPCWLLGLLLEGGWNNDIQHAWGLQRPADFLNKWGIIYTNTEPAINNHAVREPCG